MVHFRHIPKEILLAMSRYIGEPVFDAHCSVFNCYNPIVASLKDDDNLYVLCNEHRAFYLNCQKLEEGNGNS